MNDEGKAASRRPSAGLSLSRVIDTRASLLDALLENRSEGLTLEDLAARLGVTRNAVRQHVTALERDGLVTARGLRKGPRRPSRTYGLTERGEEEFPRRYDLLAVSMLQTLRSRLGEEAAQTVLLGMVDEIAARWLPRLERLEPEARRSEVVAIMNLLGYHASPAPEVGGVAAVNCVYHKVARETRAVCRFDEALLSRLLGSEVRLTACMAEGDGSCVFASLQRTEEPLPAQRPDV